MIIKTVALGNNEESYIEKRISDGVNIILSDDNNKGKTILIQSMLYAIGNNPIFPDSFDYKNYYYYLKFEQNDKDYEIIRKGDSFIVQTDNILHMLDGISELKRYWTKEIFDLPEFQFRGKQHLSDLELFIQLFFVGQDAKNTSNIFNSGYYHKDDFKNMLLSYSGVSVENLSSDDERRIKRELESLRAARKDKLDLSDFYKSHSAATEYISHIKDKDAFNQKVADMESITEKISELKKVRSKSASKRALWNSTLKELNSLNRNIEVGELRCMDCNSTNITYKGQGKDSYSFDVSTPEMRKHIIDSIKEKIDNFSEDISRYDAEINKYQIELNRVMEEDDVTIENIVAFKSGFTSIEEIDSAITEIDNQIAKLQGELDSGAKISEEAKEKRQKFFQKFIEDMKGAVYGELEGLGISLSDIGINSVSDYNKPGQLSLDEEKFSKALKENGELVYKATTAGLEKIKKVTYNYAGSSGSVFAKKAGIEKTSTGVNNLFSEQIKKQEERIKELKAKMQERQEELYAKFASLESSMNTLNSQMNYLINSMSS